MRAHTISRVLPVALALWVGGCAQLPGEAPKQAPAAPQITEGMLRERAREQLTLGIKQYEAGDFDNAQKNLQGALDHGLLPKQEQSVARKNLAFIHCVQNREAQCKDEFRKAFEINTDFALTPAEDGHPIWGPVYRTVRTQLLAEREAAARKPTNFMPLGKAEQMLADGIVKYDAGDYTASHKLLEDALREGLRDKADQVRAMKHAAFSTCLLGNYSKCRGEFIKIYDVDPNFDLTPAEAGHPSWTKTFASAKALAKKQLADKAAREARDKARATPPVAPATTPRK
ncbi:MAG TPA: TssQ family T6SS-associated lipoprotein [Usitatibacter sp.]|jgi:tetratricopeptide (TPR) repeat protein|nr:TssQ family T6SS-associated lipoprotein [Usitatibacter sp.]